MVSSRAFEISDEDVGQLKAAGYSEDAIFELPTDSMRKTGARLIRIIGYGPATQKTSFPE